MSHLEGELGWGARGDGTERAPEVDGGGQRTGSEQHRSLEADRSERETREQGDRQKRKYTGSERQPERPVVKDRHTDK